MGINSGSSMVCFTAEILLQHYELIDICISKNNLFQVSSFINS